MKSSVLKTVFAMRDELAAIWARSSASREQLVKQLEDWCQRAEGSGIAPLREFSHATAPLRVIRFHSPAWPGLPQKQKQESPPMAGFFWARTLGYLSFVSL